MLWKSCCCGVAFSRCRTACISAAAACSTMHAIASQVDLLRPPCRSYAAADIGLACQTEATVSSTTFVAELKRFGSVGIRFETNLQLVVVQACGHCLEGTNADRHVGPRACSHCRFRSSHSIKYAYEYIRMNARCKAEGMLCCPAGSALQSLKCNSRLQ